MSQKRTHILVQIGAEGAQVVLLQLQQVNRLILGPDVVQTGEHAPTALDYCVVL
jgi:hypothetical protein